MPASSPSSVSASSPRSSSRSPPGAASRSTPRPHPRAPPHITAAATGLLRRYYPKGNANFWAWTLLGNKDARGWDLAPPDKKTPEFGGRGQVPLFKGELGATYHPR